LSADLREDKQFFMDHPGAVPITTAQVQSTINFLSPTPFLLLEGEVWVLHSEVIDLDFDICCHFGWREKN